MLARKWSLRLLENSLNPQTALRGKMGLPEIHRTTISKALEDRSVDIFQRHYFHLLNSFASRCFKSRKCGRELTIIDATTIRMPPNLCDWADFKHGSKGIKLHMVMESTPDIPQFFKLSLGTEQEITIARTIVDKFPKDRILVCDKAYFAWDFFQRLDKRGVQFVIPAKRNLAFEVESEIPREKLPEDVICDQIVAFTSRIAVKYKPVYRRIIFRNPKNGEEWVYITNCWDPDAETIVEIYRQRWKIEIFFRWIKQHLKIISFWGSSRNAVEIQIWIALMVYLVMCALSLQSKWGNEKSPYYCYHFVRDKLFERTNLGLSNQILLT